MVKEWRNPGFLALSTFVPLMILLFLPFPKREREREREQKSLFTLENLYYPLLGRMFYANMHSISPGRFFWVTMFGQSFQITSLSIRHVLSMLTLDACLPSFPLEVQSLTPREFLSLLISLYGVPLELPTYIPLASFSKPTWILVTYIFFLSFAPLSQDSPINCSFHPHYLIQTTV